MGGGAGTPRATGRARVRASKVATAACDAKLCVPNHITTSGCHDGRLGIASARPVGARSLAWSVLCRASGTWASSSCTAPAWPACTATISASQPLLSRHAIRRCLSCGGGGSGRGRGRGAMPCAAGTGTRSDAWVWRCAHGGSRGSKEGLGRGQRGQGHRPGMVGGGAGGGGGLATYTAGVLRYGGPAPSMREIGRWQFARQPAQAPLSKAALM